MSWEDAEREAESAGGMGKFINLKDGDEPVVGVFCGEPYVRKQFWNGKNYEEYTEAHEKRGEKPARQFSINFYDVNSESMRILQGTLAFYIALREAKDLYGLDGNVFQVNRSGEKAGTRYSVLILPKAEAPETMPDMWDLVEEVGRGREDSDLPF
jgi:hypothetical protein